MTPSDELVHRPIAATPALAPVLEEHLTDQEGELLAYLLMGDVARWLDGQSRNDPRRVAQVLEWLEQEFFVGDFDVRNLIDVGIIEMLPAMPEGAPVLDMLGPELRDRAEIAGLLA